MTNDRLITLAESCSAVRASIGRMLLAGELTEERAEAREAYRAALRMLLRAAREEECGMYLEIAGELSSAR